MGSNSKLLSSDTKIYPKAVAGLGLSSAKLGVEKEQLSSLTLFDAAFRFPLQRVRCRAEVIIAYAPCAIYACETHAVNRREVYCPPSPSALLTQIKLYVHRICIPRHLVETIHCSEAGVYTPYALEWSSAVFAKTLLLME